MLPRQMRQQSLDFFAISVPMMAHHLLRRPTFVSHAVSLTSQRNRFGDDEDQQTLQCSFHLR
jgi:hypothetical protein